MEIKIIVRCPRCMSELVKKNGKKSSGKQNYSCLECKRQFIGDHALDYKGCHSKLSHRIMLMLVRGVGIRDISVIEEISTDKVLSVLTKSHKTITHHYIVLVSPHKGETLFQSYLANSYNYLLLN